MADTSPDLNRAAADPSDASARIGRPGAKSSEFPIINVKPIMTEVMYSVLSFIDHQFHSFRVTDQLSAGVNCNYMFLKQIDATITRELHYPAAGTHTDPCMCAEHYT
jgi:hypothetical protein